MRGKPINRNSNHMLIDPGVESSDREQNVTRRARGGNIVVLSAGILVILLGFAAFTVDIGYIALVKGQLQNAVDAATLAAAMELDPGGDQTEVEANVKQAVIDLASVNPVDKHAGLLIDPLKDIQLGRRDWDPINQTFVSNFGRKAQPYNIVRVTGRLDMIAVNDGENPAYVEDRRISTFFAPVIGHDNVKMMVTSVATFQPGAGCGPSLDAGYCGRDRRDSLQCAWRWHDRGI
jgi:hypothetical protein